MKEETRCRQPSPPGPADVARADAAWRIYAFADTSGRRLRQLAQSLAESANSPIARFTLPGANIDSLIDVRAVFQPGHRDLNVDESPPMLLPRKGRLGLIDYEKAYSPDLKTAPTSSTCVASTVTTVQSSSFAPISTLRTFYRWTRTRSHRVLRTTPAGSPLASAK